MSGLQKPIRVLHVLSAMNLGGTETLLMNLYRKIDRSLVQFDFAVSIEQEGVFDQEIISFGGIIYHYPRYRGVNHLTYVNWWNDFFNRHPDYRIVHGHIGSTAAIYLSIAKQHGCFTIAHSHATSGAKSLKTFIYKCYSFPTRFIADYFFGCSQRALIDRYGERIARNTKKSSVLKNAIDTELFCYNKIERNRIREEYNVDDNTIVLGTVGRLVEEKNPFEIVRICSELKQRGLKFVFWWFGDGPLKSDIMDLIISNKLEDSVKMLGTRKDIYRCLQGMDVFLFPSISEGLGIACVEAQASGLPTLCSSTVPVEAKVSDFLYYLPLNLMEKWVDEIVLVSQEVENADYRRPSIVRELKKEGYDINEVACFLTKFYLERIDTPIEGKCKNELPQSR